MRRVALLSALLLVACDQSTSSQAIHYPESGSPALANYQHQCSACHAPPRPAAHTAAEWPSVIARMQQHRMERRMASIQEGQLTILRDYLIRNAGEDRR